MPQKNRLQSHQSCSATVILEMLQAFTGPFLCFSSFCLLHRSLRTDTQEPSTLSFQQLVVLCLLREAGKNRNFLDFFIYISQFSSFKFWNAARIQEGFSLDSVSETH